MVLLAVAVEDGGCAPIVARPDGRLPKDRLSPDRVGRERGEEDDRLVGQLVDRRRRRLLDLQSQSVRTWPIHGVPIGPEAFYFYFSLAIFPQWRLGSLKYDATSFRPSGV